MAFRDLSEARILIPSTLKNQNKAKALEEATLKREKALALRSLRSLAQRGLTCNSRPLNRRSRPLQAP